MSVKIDKVINKVLSFGGIKVVRHTTLEKLHNQASKKELPADISRDSSFLSVYEKIRPFTLVEIERCYALYKAIHFILANNISGDLVECGVWKGGSCMLMAYTLLEAGEYNRTIWLYDTFAGMTAPGVHDGEMEKSIWVENKITPEKSSWCLGEFDEVKKNLLSTGYPADKIRFIRGKVEDTIPHDIPAQIALLRLDTDWYSSTKHELEHLYPLLQKNGILIIDDYGAWQGAQKATDEYFSKTGPVLLNRIDYTGRLVIK
jgi:hypothetical protein